MQENRERREVEEKVTNLKGNKEVTEATLWTKEV